MLKKFLILCLMLLSTNTAFSKEIRIIHITDSHLETSNQETSKQDNTTSEQILINTIKDVNKIKGTTFAIFTGDNIDKPNPEDLKMFLKIANKLNCPYYVVIGNHEISKYQHFLKKDYMNIVRKYSKNCHFKEPNYVFKKKGMVFIVVDGVKEVIPGTAGYFKEDTLKWLDRTLKKYKNKNVVIFQHFPIEAPFFYKTHTTFDADGYKTILDKHSNVISIVSGHYHANSEKMIDGIYHINTPSLLEKPHEYKVIDIKIKKNKKIYIYTQTRHAQ